METVIRHAGISTLSMIGASALTAAVFINPVGAAMFVSGVVWWLHDRARG